MSYGRYGRFFVVGSIAALATIACREVVALTLTGDSVVGYALSVIAAYAIGIVIGFELNRRFTFRDREAAQWTRLPAFVAVACTGLATTALLSIAFRYGLGLDPSLGRLAAPAAFAAATLCASAITYPLTASWVFPDDRIGRDVSVALMPLRRGGPPRA